MRRPSPARGKSAGASAVWLAQRERLATAQRIQAIADAQGRSDVWLAARLRVSVPRLSALYAGIIPSAAERQRIDEFVAAEGG